MSRTNVAASPGTNENWDGEPGTATAATVTGVELGVELAAELAVDPLPGVVATVLDEAAAGSGALPDAGL